MYFDQPRDANWSGELKAMGRRSYLLDFDSIKNSSTATTLVAGLAMLLVFTVSAVGQEPDRELELELLRDEIATLTLQLRRVKRESGGLAGQLERTQVALKLQEKRVAEARSAGAIAAESLTLIEQQARELQSELVVKRKELRQRLSALYRLGRQGYLRLILSIRAEQDLLPGIRQLRFLATRDASLLGRFLRTQNDLKSKREEVLVRREEMDEWLELESVRLAQLSRLQKQQESILSQLEREGSVLTAQTERLKQKEVKLANFLDFLYGRAGSSLSGTPMSQFQGVLDWPVQGTVKTGFGPRQDSKYMTTVPHNGLQIATRPGTQARVVFPGKVLFAAPFQGYGLTAVVNHPGRFFTLYAGLVQLQVRQGDMVSLGAVVGRTGGDLYFELRVENQPVDPRKWLR